MNEVVRLAETSSTQAEAIAGARAGRALGTTWIARTQRAGRGRLDHRWVSPPGGLYLSVLVRAPDAHPELLTLAVGVEVATALERAYGIALRLRWPNDLVVAEGGAKLGGILAELIERPAGPTAVVGIGVNVAIERADLPEALRGSVAILRELVPAAPRPEEVEAPVRSAIDRAAARLADGGGAPAVVAEALARLEGRGRPVCLDGLPVGTIRGLDPLGRLLVTTPQGAVRAHDTGSLSYADGAGGGAAAAAHR